MTTLDESNHLTESDRELLTQLKEVVRNILPDADILLYGSVARGVSREDSDYDLLVLTEAPLTVELEGKVDGAIYDLQLEHGVLILASYRIRNHWDANPRMPFYQEVERDAIRL